MAKAIKMWQELGPKLASATPISMATSPATS